MPTIGTAGAKCDLVFRDGCFQPAVWRFAGLDLTGYQFRAALETPDGVKHSIAVDLLSANATESFVRFSLTAPVWASMPARMRVATLPWDFALLPPVGEPVPVAWGDAHLVRSIANVG